MPTVPVQEVNPSVLHAWYGGGGLSSQVPDVKGLVLDRNSLRRNIILDKLVVKTGLVRMMVMKEVGAYDAKTHFAELLDEVEKGEVILITRRGKPVARIVPHQTEQMSLDDIIEGFERLRKQISAEGPSIREMIEEGRRY